MVCCNGLLIQIKEIPAGTPSWMTPEGKLFLDLSQDSGIALGKALGELTDVNKIADEAAVGLTIPATKKNRFILDASINPNAAVEEIRIQVAIFQGPGVVPFDQLVVATYNDESKTIECELLRGDDHWIQKASTLLIKDIPDLNSVYWPNSPFDIQQHWIDAVPYVDEDLGYVLAPVDYSGGVDDDGNTGWMENDRIVPEDLRPWVSDLYLLQKGFCAIGWGFSSPFHDTDYAKHLYSYLCGSDYGEDPELLESYEVLATASQQEYFQQGAGSSVATGVLYEGVIKDGFGSLIIGVEDVLADTNDQVTKFRGIGVFDFFAEVSLSVPLVDPTVSSVAWLEIVKKDEVTGKREVKAGPYSYFPVPVFGVPIYDTELKVTATWENLTVGYDDSVYVQLRTEISFFPVPYDPLPVVPQLFIESGSFSNTPRRALPVRGFQTNLKNLFDGKLTFLDFFKGCIFDFDGKIVTNYETRTVEVYPPETTIIYNDEEIEGFYKTSNVPIDNVVCDSLTVTNAEASTPRYALIKFKDSNDPSVEAEPTPENIPLHARLVDRGEGFKEETQEYSNPLFEPTTTAKVQTVFDDVATTAVILPRLWDNDSGETSFDCGFRKLYFWESQPQFFLSDTGAEPAQMRLMNQVISSFPYGFQKPKAFKAGLVLPEERYVYGAEDDFIGDFFFFFWRFRALFRDYRTFSFVFQASLYDYKGLDFRKWQTINYNSHPYVGRIKGVSNFDLCTGRMQVEFFPASAFIDCPTREDLANCENNPKISLGIDDETCCVTARGDDNEVVSPIDAEEWEYTADGESWNSYIPGQPVCNEDILIFNRYVTFSDGCPPKGRTKMFTKDQICLNYGIIEITYNEVENTVAAVGMEYFNSTIEQADWYVNIDGQGWGPYTEGVEIPAISGQLFCFRWDISFVNCCPDLLYEDCIEIEPGPADCGNSDLELVLVDEGNCEYIPEIQGTILSVIGHTAFDVSKDGGLTWTPWNGNYIEPGENLKVRAMVFFCDGCPPVCLEADCPQE